MIYFFFDLDNTLMDTNSFHFLHNHNIRLDNAEKKYQENILKDPKLYCLLSKIKNPKYLISNGSRLHCLYSLKSLGIFNLFKGGVDSNSIDKQFLKPDIRPYLAAIELSNFDIIKDKGIFFDDIVENHILPKIKLKWITVLIHKTIKKKPLYIDYIFTNIYDALLFFIRK